MTLKKGRRGVDFLYNPRNSDLTFRGPRKAPMKRSLALTCTAIMIGLVASLGSELLDSGESTFVEYGHEQSAEDRGSLSIEGRAVRRSKSSKRAAAEQRSGSEAEQESSGAGFSAEDKGQAGSSEGGSGPNQVSQRSPGAKVLAGGQAGESPRGPVLRWRKDSRGRRVPVYDSKERARLDQSADKIADQRGTLLGALEAVTAASVTGYAYDWKKPDLVVTVDVYVDGFLVKSVQANQKRASKSPLYSQKGFASGPLEALKDGVKHTVQVFARLAAEDGEGASVVELAGSPRTFGGATVPVGRIEQVTGGTVIGWVLDPGQPSKPLEVELLWDGQSQGVVLANQGTPPGQNPAPELDQHWFQWTLPEHDEKTQHTLQLIARRGSLRRELDRSPWLINRDKKNENKVPYGALTFVNDSQISGWALDPDVEDQAISVDIFIDGEFLERQVADKLFAALVHRPDVKNPNHLWILDIPEKYKDGKEHSLSVFAVNNPDGANPELSGSPRFFRSEVNNKPIGFVDVVNANILGGWAYDADAGAEAVEVEIWIDGALWKTILADGNRPDLVPVVCPEAEHGWSAPAPEILKDGKFHVVRVYARNTPNGPKTELSGSPRELAAKKPELGVSIQSIPNRGLRVSRVVENSPAQAASLRVGDVITQYNGQTAQVDPVVFEQWLLTREIGEAITLSVERDVSIETPPFSGLPQTIKTAIEAFEDQVLSGAKPQAKTLELADGRKVHLQERNQTMVQTWSQRQSLEVYPVLRQKR